MNIHNVVYDAFDRLFLAMMCLEKCSATTYACFGRFDLRGRLSIWLGYDRSQTTGKCVVDAPTTTTNSYWGTLYGWTATKALRACITKKTSAPFCALLNALGDVK